MGAMMGSAQVSADAGGGGSGVQWWHSVIEAKVSGWCGLGTSVTGGLDESASVSSIGVDVVGGGG